MKEFGSDFHLVEGVFQGGESLLGFYPKAVLFANGRHALETVLRQGRYARIWLPDYFCYEVVGHVRRMGVEVAFYPDCPLESDDDRIIRGLPFRRGDVLLRVNYFGWRGRRDSAGIPVPVIEDHSHDLLGEWANGSNADWCVASLRKTLPLPEGGILWSPRGNSLEQPESTEENEGCSRERLEGMRLKRDYLRGKKVDKGVFREMFLRTEEELGRLALSGLSAESLRMLGELDVVGWYRRKKENWECLVKGMETKAELSMIEKGELDTPFSFVIRLGSRGERDRVRGRLIEERVYPAVLWDVPDTAGAEARSFSGRMLSIHCDGRYAPEDMGELRSRLLKALE